MRPSLLLDAGSYSLSRWKVNGIGLRAAELADALSAECRVRVLVPEDDEDLLPLGEAEAVRAFDWDRVLAEADVAMFFDDPDPGRLNQAAASTALVVSENVAPIEHAEYPRLLAAPDPAKAHRALVDTYARQLAVSDHFLCRSEVERATLVANLCLTGAFGPADIACSRTLAHLVSLVPIGFSARSAREAAATEPVHLADFLWTGGIWNFLDPLTFVRAVGRCHQRGAPVTAAFLHAAPVTDNADLVAALHHEVEALDLGDAVQLLTEPVAHGKRDAYLLGARGLVCLGKPGAENQTCVRLRVRDSRLLGVSLVVDGYGATAREAEQGGVRTHVVPDPTPDSLAAVLADLGRGPAPGPTGAHEDFCYDHRLRGFLTWLTTALA